MKSDALYVLWLNEGLILKNNHNDKHQTIIRDWTKASIWGCDWTNAMVWNEGNETSMGGNENDIEFEQRRDAYLRGKPAE